jgi:hypothetical protein
MCTTKWVMSSMNQNDASNEQIVAKIPRSEQQTILINI